MFGSIGPWELAIILLIALMIVGPGKLPDVAKSIAKGLSEFKKVTNGVRQEFEDVMKEEAKPAPMINKTEAVNPLDAIDLSKLNEPVIETVENTEEIKEKNIDDNPTV